MSKEDMIQARELIQQKKYDEARAILRKTSHQQAPAWLAKLDEIDPPAADPEATLIEKKPQAAVIESPSPINRPKPQGEERKIPLPVVVGCLGLFLLAAVCTIGAVWASSQVATFFGGVADFYEDFSTARPISYGVPVSGALSEANDFNEYWIFEAAAGDRVVITLRSSEIDTLLSLYEEDQTFLVDDDDSGGGVDGTDSLIEFTIPDNGRYVIVAGQWFTSEGGGSYTLSVQEQ